MRTLTEDAAELLAEVNTNIQSIVEKLILAEDTEASYRGRNFAFVAPEIRGTAGRDIERYNKMLDGDGVNYGLRQISEILALLAEGKPLSRGRYDFLEDVMGKREAMLARNEEGGKPRPPKELLALETFWENHQEEIGAGVSLTVPSNLSTTTEDKSLKPGF